MAWESKYEDALQQIYDKHQFTMGCLVIVGGDRGESFVRAWPRHHTPADFARNARIFAKNLRMLAEMFDQDAAKAERTERFPGMGED